MTTITYLSKKHEKLNIEKSFLEGKRNLTCKEITILEKNRNYCENWNNVYVSDGKECFDAELIRDSRFEGFVIIGRLVYAKLKYHDLELDTGIVNSFIRNSIIGDDNVILNVSYMDNYHTGNMVMLFNIQEISCIKSSRFGNGVNRKDISEDTRVWIGIRNENDGRAVLANETMIPADAYIWSKYRDDSVLMHRFLELTDNVCKDKLVSYGSIGNNVVIKNTTLIKDAKIGDCSYIKGAFKLKNLTILSSEDEPSQIGEGVELVNGIMGYGSRVFYQAVGIRFVLGRNCQLKYGARLINSILGDNSTVSCCELLNNLIFPFHEQHHNSSFLIATMVMGQSNIAAGATIGSNHNSRSPDGEIIAGRGFWPGLCSDFKHNSHFASFTLASKGSYQHELDVQYPFALLLPGDTANSPVHIIPAWWFMYDMFAIVRNNYKFKKRDKRVVKIQNIETNPFAPDTMQETLKAVKKIIELTAANLSQLDASYVNENDSPDSLRQSAKDFLHNTKNEKFTLFDVQSQKKHGAIIYKPLKAYKVYRQVLKYFAVKTLMEFCHRNSFVALEEIILSEINLLPLYTEWVNVGGQVMPKKKLEKLISLIKEKKINDWEQVHAFYNEVQNNYDDYKARYSVEILEQLYSRSIKEFDNEIYSDIVDDVSNMSELMYNSSVESREKDFTDYYRCMPYDSKEEMTAVLGSIKDNDFLKELERDTKNFKKDLKILFKGLTL